ncbi:MAG TPA: Trm112 family protein [Nitrososphaeraceae archaeon]|nr:Trm112 family protein [Nitrososphaeraceae archaeon]
MKKNLLDILACPMDKHYPLDLVELDIKEFDGDNINDNSFSNNDEKNKNNNNIQTNGEKSFKKSLGKDNIIIIIEGILYCKKCSRFYPIIDEIPILLPDELREKDKEVEFLNKWKNNIPQQILHNANPWHL